MKPRPHYRARGAPAPCPALTLYASEPDVIAEILAIADELEASPMAPAGRRLRRLVAGVEVVERAGPAKRQMRLEL